MKDAALVVVGFDDLDALAGGDEAPVFEFGIREELLQGFEAVFRRLKTLLDEVFGEVEVIGSDGKHGGEVGELDRAGEVEDGAGFEELGGKSSEGAEEEGALAIDDAGVEVGDGHGRGAYGGFTVDFGLVLVDDIGVVADEELAAYGETSKAFSFFDFRFLEEG